MNFISSHPSADRYRR